MIISVKIKVTNIGGGGLVIGGINSGNRDDSGSDCSRDQEMTAESHE